MHTRLTLQALRLEAWFRAIAARRKYELCKAAICVQRMLRRFEAQARFKKLLATSANARTGRPPPDGPSIVATPEVDGPGRLTSLDAFERELLGTEDCGEISEAELAAFEASIS